MSKNFLIKTKSTSNVPFCVPLETLTDYDPDETSKNEAEYFLKTNEIASKNNWAIVDLSSKIKEELLPIDTEINQLKQELKRVEGPEGFGALKPIYNFYENIVTNILRKQYGKKM